MANTINPTNYASVVNVMANLKEDVNLPELRLCVMMERKQLVQKELKDQLGDQKARNEAIANLSNALQEVRARRPTGTNEGWVDVPAGKRDAQCTVRVGEQDVPMKKFLDDMGVKHGDLQKMNAQQFDDLISNLKSSIDTLTSTAQLEMVRTQSLSDKDSQLTEMISNFLSRDNRDLEKILGNIRG